MTQIPNILIPDKGKDSSGPFWHPDTRERLRVLAPELLISIVAATCLTTLTAYRDVEDLGMCIMAMCLAQIFTQTVLYVFTYLTSNLRSSYIGLAATFAMFYIAGFSSTVDGSLGMPFDNFGLFIAVATMMGAMLFYATRPRWAFVLLAIGLATVATDGVQAELLPVLLVCFASYLALFIMRSAAARITLDYVSRQQVALEREGDEETTPPLGGTYGQVVALGASIGALCLAVALASIPLFGQLFESDEPASGPTSATVQEDQSHDTETTSDAASEKRDDVEPETVEGATGADDTKTSGDSTETTEVENGQRTESRNPAPLGLIAFLLLPIAAVLPFAVRLFLRKQARNAIESESRPANRIARIYLGVLARLEAAGIARKEFETPREFFATNETELAKLTAPAGIGVEEWSALTSAYEKSRYADLDPTESELETCWKLYDALPSCTHHAIGWPRYLTNAFWRM